MNSIKYNTDITWNCYFRHRDLSDIFIYDIDRQSVVDKNGQGNLFGSQGNYFSICFSIF